MTQDIERDDARVAAALRDGLAARDRARRAPAFTALWRDRDSRTARTARWRPALAAAATLVVLTTLSWTWLGPLLTPQGAGTGRLDVALARELSSPDFWQVPTDELLAYAAPPLSAALPEPTGLDISLEESLL